MTDYTFKSNFTTKIDFRQAKTPKTNSLTVVYIHGLYSDCWGRKPENVMEWCAANGVNFFRFELAGHGSDSARYEETDVNIWKAQLLEVIDDIVKTDVILAGSSLGGWLSLLAALERPEKVKGVLGLAAAGCGGAIENAANGWEMLGYTLLAIVLGCAALALAGLGLVVEQRKEPQKIHKVPENTVKKAVCGRKVG